MAYSISPILRSLADQINKEPVLVLEIEGSRYLYGSAPILETARWDDPRVEWDNVLGVTWDGEIERGDSRPYIIIKGQTTKDITQQLLVDKGGSGSVSTMNIELVDYRGEVAEDLSFDQIGEPLGKKANIYLGMQGGRFPQDYIQLIKGYVDDLRYNAGSIAVSVTLSTNLIRQSAYEQYISNTTSPIDAITTTIPVATSEPLLESQDVCITYIRIEDEIMEVVGKSSNSLTVIRARLGTIATSHDAESEVVSNYALSGNPIDLALKLLHSKAGNGFNETVYNVSALNRISASELIEGAIVVDNYDIEATSGAIIGDLIELIGTASNDGIKTITGFGKIITGKSYFTVSETLTEETGLTVSLKLKSKYNVLSDGAGLDLDFIDSSDFEEVKSLYSASFIDYSFLVKDTMSDVREFIISEICRPQSLYLIPRKAKTSLKFTAPPFSVDEVPILNTENLYDMTKIEMRRSTHKYLLNSIIYRYNQGILEDKFFDKLIKLNADSFSRIAVGRKRLEIDSSGLGRSPEVAQVLDRMASRILNRYKFGARYIRNVKPLLSVGLTIEIGDIVFFGGEDTQLVNLQTGARDLPATQYEVINKKLNPLQGEVVLELLETGFGVDGIFGVYSPSSKIISGSTQTRLLIGELWDSDQYETEREKWDRWIGLKLRVRSDDYTFDEICTLDSFDPVTNNGLIISGLSTVPPVGGFVELAKYGEYSEEELEEVAKLTYTFTMRQAEVDTVTDNKTFDVLDATELEVGMEINIHSEDYTADSQTRAIDDIAGNTITLNEDLDITPVSGDKLEVYSFPGAKGYRIL